MIADDSRTAVPRDFDESNPGIVESTYTDTDQIGRIALRQSLDDFPAFGCESTGWPINVVRSKKMLRYRQYCPKARGRKKGMARPDLRILV
jgi:hypothetical protein